MNALKLDKNMKITKGDIKFFVLGILTFLIVDTIMNWDDAKKSFQEGYNDTRGIESSE